MYTFKIWFKYHHDDFSVAEIHYQQNPERQVRELVREGGLWCGPRFVPFHCITTIECIEETTNGDSASRPEAGSGVSTSSPQGQEGASNDKT